MEAEKVYAPSVIEEDLSQCLKQAIADEYVLLNNTSQYLLDENTPFNNRELQLIQTIYQQLKTNAGLLTEAFKSKAHYSTITINDIIANAHLKKTELANSKIEVLERMLQDHWSVVNYLQDVLVKNEHVFGGVELSAMETVQLSHKEICSSLQKFVEEFFKHSSN